MAVLAKLSLPELGFGNAPAIIEIERQGNLTISKGHLIWTSYKDKTNKRKYTWRQLATHLDAGGTEAVDLDGKARKAKKAKKAKRPETDKKAAPTHKKDLHSIAKATTRKRA